MEIIKLIDQDLDEDLARDTAIYVHNFAYMNAADCNKTVWRIDHSHDRRKTLFIFSDNTLTDTDTHVAIDMLKSKAGVDDVILMPGSMDADEILNSTSWHNESIYRKIASIVSSYEDAIGMRRLWRRKIRFMYAPKDNAVLLFSTEPYIISTDSELLNRYASLLCDIKDGGIEKVVLTEVSDCLAEDESHYDCGADMELD